MTPYDVLGPIGGAALSAAVLYVVNRRKTAADVALTKAQTEDVAEQVSERIEKRWLLSESRYDVLLKQHSELQQKYETLKENCEEHERAAEVFRHEVTIQLNDMREKHAQSVKDREALRAAVTAQALKIEAYERMQNPPSPRGHITGTIIGTMTPDGEEG